MIHRVDHVQIPALGVCLSDEGVGAYPFSSGGEAVQPPESTVCGYQIRYRMKERAPVVKRPASATVTFRAACDLIAFLLTSCSRVFAQAAPCTQQDMENRTGTWKTREDFLRPGENYKPEMKAEIFKRLDRIQQVIRQAYPNPRGADAFTYRQIFGTPLYKSGAVTYAISDFLLHYYCASDSHKPMLEDESSDWINISVNSFNPEFSFDASLKVGHLFAVFMSPRVGQLKGVDLFQTSLVRADERFIIISREGQSPYLALTRKQYLVALKEKFEREKKLQLDKELPYNKDEASRARLIAANSREFDPKLRAIDDYLSTHLESDLNQTAFVKTVYDTKFTEENKGGRMIAILNIDYFNKGLSPYLPQMMLLRWRWDDGEGPPGGILRPVPPDMNVCCRVSKYYKDSIEQNIDVNALRQLLDQ